MLSEVAGGVLHCEQHGVWGVHVVFPNLHRSERTHVTIQLCGQVEIVPVQHEEVFQHIVILTAELLGHSSVVVWPEPQIKGSTSSSTVW